MLGTHIKKIRIEKGISMETLALDASVPIEILEGLEREEIERFHDQQMLLRVADRLSLATAHEFAAFLRANKPRRFRAYNVGAIKSGTVSIMRLFARHRSAHEYDGWRTSHAYYQFKRGEITETEFRAFLRRRDIAGALEMDSSGFLYRYVDLLADEFPDARFLLTMRDPYSWLDSIVNYILNPYEGEFLSDGRKDLGLPFDLPSRDAAAREKVRPILHRSLDTILKRWTAQNEYVLGAVPAGRLLVVRTHEIGDNLEEIADFVGAPLDSIEVSLAHSHPATYKAHFLHELDREELAGKFQRICEPLATRFFPEFSLDRFLEKDRLALEKTRI